MEIKQSSNYSNPSGSYDKNYSLIITKVSDNGLAVIGDNIQFVIFIVIIFNFSTFMVKIYYIYSEPDYYIYG